MLWPIEMGRIERWDIQEAERILGESQAGRSACEDQFSVAACKMMEGGDRPPLCLYAGACMIAHIYDFWIRKVAYKIKG